jgi:hypothetical protein
MQEALAACEADFERALRNGCYTEICLHTPGYDKEHKHGPRPIDCKHTWFYHMWHHDPTGQVPPETMLLQFQEFDSIAGAIGFRWGHSFALRASLRGAWKSAWRWNTSMQERHGTDIMDCVLEYL